MLRRGTSRCGCGCCWSYVCLPRSPQLNCHTHGAVLPPLQGTRRLFVLIQGEAEGRAAAARVARALGQQGPARMADVLGSLVARTLRDRLALLSTLGVTARQQVGGAGSEAQAVVAQAGGDTAAVGGGMLSLSMCCLHLHLSTEPCCAPTHTSALLQMVLGLLNQMLEVAEKAAAGRGSRSSGGSSQRAGRSTGGGGLRLPDFGGAGSEEDEEEEGKQELLALMQKLKVRQGVCGASRAAANMGDLQLCCSS